MNKKDEKIILVIGATGLLGEPVARQLQKEGYSVRIFAKDYRKAEEKFDDSFKIVKGDVSDIPTIENALEGCFGVYISLRGGPKPEDFEKVEHLGVVNIVNAAAKMNVKHLIYLTGAFSNESKSDKTILPMLKAKSMAMEEIKKGKVPYTIFHATQFMENLPRFIRGKKASIIGKQPHPVHWLAVKDYAEIVSKAFEVKDAENKNFFVFGPEALTMREGLEKYCSMVHPDITVSTAPFWAISLVAKLTNNHELKFFIGLMKHFEKFGEYGDPTKSDTLFGKPETTLKEWSRQQETMKYRSKLALTLHPGA